MAAYTRQAHQRQAVGCWKTGAPPTLNECVCVSQCVFTALPAGGSVCLVLPGNRAHAVKGMLHDKTCPLFLAEHNAIQFILRQGQISKQYKVHNNKKNIVS